MPRRPDFAIIGAQKAASTELMRVLADQADCTLLPDEAHFFRDPLYDEALVPAFLAGLPEVTTARFGIKCPDYLGRPEVPERLARHLDGLQLIACLRNPVERAVSAYHWYVQWGVLPLADVNAGLQRLLDGDPTLPPAANQVLSYGLYAQHLRAYLDHFPARSLHVVLHDDLRADYQGTVAGLLTFLALPASADASRPGRANSGVYSPARLRLLRRRNRHLVRWSDDRSDVRIERPHGAWPWLMTKGVTATDRWLLARVVPNATPALDPGVQSRLEAYYGEDVKRLEELLDRDLDSWRTAS